jgi:hypothetical protein
MQKICKKCSLYKDEIEFSPSQLKSNFSRCKSCVSIFNKKYRDDNLEKIKAADRKSSANYYNQNKEKILTKQSEKYYANKSIKQNRNKNYYQNNRIKLLNDSKKYYLYNKEKIKNYHNIYFKRKRKDNLSFKIKTCISANIYFYLKNKNSLKNGKPVLKYLNYSIEELKFHLQSQFEPWMNWSNYGKYNSKTWKDDDESTWTWQIDHIIPHSTFNYSSMEDEEFKRCWSLNNLRPYNSKLNFEEGVRRTRH